MKARPDNPTEMRLNAAAERRAEEELADEQASDEPKEPTEEELRVEELGRVGLRGQPKLVKDLYQLFARTRSYMAVRGILGYGLGVQITAAKALTTARRRVDNAETEEELVVAQAKLAAAVAYTREAHRFRRGAVETAEALRKAIKCEGRPDADLPAELQLIFRLAGVEGAEDFDLTASNIPPEE